LSEIGRDAFPNEKFYLEIQELYVKETVRGNKIGEKLISTVVALAKANGIRKAMVYSGNEDYVKISHFYEKSGFKMWQIFMTKDISA
jgi:GNAT superfamily N-acetyltransferase